MSIGKAVSTRARFVYAAPETHVTFTRGISSVMNEIHLTLARLTSGSKKIDK